MEDKLQDYSDSIIDVTLKKIFESKVSVEPTVVKNYFIARTGVYSKIYNEINPSFFGGFSCKEDKAVAKKLCSFEVAERLLATYYYSNPLYRDGYYPLSSLDGSANQSIAAEKVLIGPTKKSPENAGNAIGLSFHVDQDLAVKHSVFECLERGILGRVWYENHPLILIQKSQVNDGGLILVEYTIKTDGGRLVPFVMSVIHSMDGSVFCVGARFSESFKESREKAKAEAIMLAHDVLNKKSLERIENMSSQKRMMSQGDVKINEKRIQFLRNHTVWAMSAENLLKDLSLTESLEAIKLSAKNVFICKLHTGKAGHLVRALIPEFKLLSDYRVMFAGSEALALDPVC